MSIDEVSTSFRRRRQWPVSARGDVFLIAALEEIGKAIHGDEWTGREIKWPFQPVGLDQARKVAWEADMARFMSAARITHRALLDGLLECRHRPQRGNGEMAPTPQAWWNNDEWHSRFQFGTVDPDNPVALVSYDEVRDHKNRAYLFVTRKSLDAVLRTIGSVNNSEPSSQVPSNQYLSPYLRLMIAVSSRMEVAPGNQPLKKLVVAALEAEAERSWDGRPISKNQLDYMATLIRDPESQAGGPKAGPTRKSPADGT